MTVIERKPVPIYTLVCEECKSVIEYKKNEVSLGQITCPVCRVSNPAMCIIPTRFEEGKA